MCSQGVGFKTVGWKTIWNEELDKFYFLMKTQILKDRCFFQNDNNLFIKYVFESNHYVILPIEFIEEKEISVIKKGVEL